VVLAVALYYGHFGDAYRSLQAARAQAPVAMVDGDTTVAPPRALNRVTRAGTIALDALGWPVVALGAIGVAGLVRRSRRNRVTLAVGAWLLGLLVFTVVGTMTSVDPRYVRYADEFLARTMFATYPAIVLLAASGVSWMWRFGWPARLGCVALIGWATAQGAVAWIGWLSPS